MRLTQLLKGTTSIQKVAPRLGLYGIRRSEPELIRKVTDAQKIEALASKFEPKLAAAIVAAFKQWGNKIDFDALVAALETGNTEKVVAVLNIPDIQHVMGNIGTELAATAAAGGALAGLALPRITGLAFSFDTLNPALVDYLRAYGFNLIRQMSSVAVDSIRSVMQTGFTNGINPRRMATDIKQSIGLTDNQYKAVVNFRDELTNFHLKSSADSWNLGGKIDRVNGAQVLIADADGLPKDGIISRRLRDFRYDKTLLRAMQDGEPLGDSQIDKMVDRYREKYVKYRAQTIARTESLRATNIGVQNAWKQAIDTGQVNQDLTRRLWIVSDDERTCPVCNAIPDLNPEEGVMMDEPFQTDDGVQFLPPQHPNCRCTVFIRTYEPEELAAMQADDAAQGTGDNQDQQENE